MPLSAAPGAAFSWSLHYAHPKTGYAGVWPAGTTPVFNVNTNWQSYAGSALTPVVSFTQATSAELSLTAPTVPGEYLVQNIVPADGGTVGSDTLTVTTPVAGSGPTTADTPGGVASGGTPASLGGILSARGPGGLPMGLVLGLGVAAVWLLGRR